MRKYVVAGHLGKRVVDTKRMIGKMEDRGGGGEAQGVADPKKMFNPVTL
jgi:hypothetical protein